jgi:hypothetical protein
MYFCRGFTAESAENKSINRNGRKDATDNGVLYERIHMVLWRLSFSLLRIFTAEYAESAKEENINRYGREERYWDGSRTAWV